MLLVCVQCLRTRSQRREAAFSSEKSGFIGWATECHLMSVLAEGTKEGGRWGGIEREAKWWAKTELSDSVHSNCSRSDNVLKVGRITAAHWDKFLRRKAVDALFTSSHPSHQWQFKAPQTKFERIWTELLSVCGGIAGIGLFEMNAPEGPSPPGSHRSQFSYTKSESQEGVL